MVQSPAGFWIRLIARIVDGVILSIVVWLLSMLFGMNEGTVNGATYNPLQIIGMAYFIIVPMLWLGFTIGKRAFNIRIVKMDGSTPGIGPMILRELIGSLIYGITLGIAAIISAFMVGLRKDKRAIHDLIAGTYVTHEPPEEYEA